MADRRAACDLPKARGEDTVIKKETRPHSGESLRFLVELWGIEPQSKH